MTKKGPTPRRPRHQPPQLPKAPTDKSHDPEHFAVHAIVGQEGRAPLIQLEWGDQMKQMNPETARALGALFISMAEAAKYEAGMLRFLMDRFDLPLNGAVAMLADLRESVTSAEFFDTKVEL